MSLHQRTIGKSQVRLTPRSILDPLGQFDTDPCASDPRPWDIGARNITERENSLLMDWSDFGRVWLNPPYDRRIVGRFVARMCEHGHGIALVHARTDTRWFANVFESATALRFLAGRVSFVNPDGSVCTYDDPTSKYFGREGRSGAPLVLAAFGWSDADVLCLCGLDGHFVPLRVPRSFLVEFVVPSWREVVATVLRSARGPLALADLYAAISSHPKTQGRKYWKEKVRQTLQTGAFRRLDRGLWEGAPT